MPSNKSLVWRWFTFGWLKHLHHISPHQMHDGIQQCKMETFNYSAGKTGTFNITQVTWKRWIQRLFVAHTHKNALQCSQTQQTRVHGCWTVQHLHVVRWTAVPRWNEWSLRYVTLWCACTASVCTSWETLLKEYIDKVIPSVPCVL